MKSQKLSESQERFLSWANNVGCPPVTMLATRTPAEPVSVPASAEFTAARLLVGAVRKGASERVERVASLLNELRRSDQAVVQKARTGLG